MTRTMASYCLRSLGVAIAALAVLLTTAPAGAVTIDWVTVGDAGNAADTTGFGAVASDYRIMGFEWTNSQYAEFLNAIDPQGTNPNSVYNAFMGSNARGGITNTGTTDGSRYAVKTNMGNKPVNFVSWFAGARVANWVHGGAMTFGSTSALADAPQNVGAYTVGTATSGSAVAPNSGAKAWIPTENEWYKAAYYTGTGSVYTDWATQSDTAPTAVTANGVGDGSAGGTGNFANFNRVADWNAQDGNVTTVGTNGGTSFYGTFDQSGNVFEWNDLDGTAGSSRGLRGGFWNGDASSLSAGSRLTFDPSSGSDGIGFRLASPVPVPEPSTWIMGMAGLACGAWGIVRRRRAR